MTSGTSIDTNRLRRAKPPPGTMLAMAGTGDPRFEVEAPIRAALNAIVLRATLTFIVVSLAVWATITAAHGPLHAVAHLGLPALMLGVILWRAATMVVRGQPPIPTDEAWARARATQPGDTLFATIVAAMPPIAWLVGGIAIAVRHVEHHNLGTVLAVYLPLAAALWFFATLAWAHDCRERVARAVADSERRFRDYWSNVRTSV